MKKFLILMVSFTVAILVAIILFMLLYGIQAFIMGSGSTNDWWILGRVVVVCTFFLSVFIGIDTGKELQASLLKRF